MGIMTRVEVLDDMVCNLDGYLMASGADRVPDVGYSGWRWARIAIGEHGLGREWHLYREDGLEGAITPRDYEAHKSRQQQGEEAMKHKTLNEKLDILVEEYSRWAKWPSDLGEMGSCLAQRSGIDVECRIVDDETGFRPPRLELVYGGHIIGEQDFYEHQAHKARQQKGDPNAHESVRTAEQPAWNGDGLPPVGAVVEMKSPILGMWQGKYLEAEVIAVKGRTVIGWCADKGMSLWAHHNEARPIRTNEDDAVDEMLTVTDEHLSPEDTCRALYRAGYRKAEGV